MSIGAAVRLTSPDACTVIAAASRRAQERGESCFVISIVRSVADPRSEDERAFAAQNVGLIMSRRAAPVIQEGDDVPRGIVAAARACGVDTLFVGSAKRRAIGRSVPEKLVRLAPPFEIVIVRREI